MTEIAKWRRANEVDQPGFYVMTRSDDDFTLRGQWTCEVIIVNHRAYLKADESWVATQKVTPIAAWDDECRFYGPIPQCEE